MFVQLDVYVERMLSAGDAGIRFPSVAAHLRACPPCLHDYEGLIAVLRP